MAYAPEGTWNIHPKVHAQAPQQPRAYLLWNTWYDGILTCILPRGTRGVKAYLHLTSPWNTWYEGTRTCVSPRGTRAWNTWYESMLTCVLPRGTRDMKAYVHAYSPWNTWDEGHTHVHTSLWKTWDDRGRRPGHLSCAGTKVSNSKNIR